MTTDLTIQRPRGEWHRPVIYRRDARRRTRLLLWQRSQESCAQRERAAKKTTTES